MNASLSSHPKVVELDQSWPMLTSSDGLLSPPGAIALVFGGLRDFRWWGRAVVSNKELQSSGNSSSATPPRLRETARCSSPASHTVATMHHEISASPSQPK